MEDYEKLQEVPLPDVVPEPDPKAVYDSYTNASQVEKEPAIAPDDETVSSEEEEMVPETATESDRYEEQNVYEGPENDKAPDAYKEPKPSYEPEPHFAPEPDNHYNDYGDDGDGGTVYLDDFDEGDGETVMLIDRPDGNAYLERLQTREIFHIYKNITKIGKQKATADICLTGNPTFSRQHCTISYSMGIYYIKDNGSLNHTYLDGQMLRPNEGCRLNNNSRIRISNEEFIFRTGEA